MIASRETTLLTRAKREVQILEAVINVTTPFTRYLIDLSARTHGVANMDGHWPHVMSKIRCEFTRLRRRKGRGING
jgi:hypothetical protein